MWPRGSWVQPPSFAPFFAPRLRGFFMPQFRRNCLHTVKKTVSYAFNVPYSCNRTVPINIIERDRSVAGNHACGERLGFSPLSAALRAKFTTLEYRLPGENFSTRKRGHCAPWRRRVILHELDDAHDTWSDGSPDHPRVFKARHASNTLNSHNVSGIP